MQNYIYYVLNSGIKYSERYVDKTYVNYLDDINDLTKNKGENFKKKVPEEGGPRTIWSKKIVLEVKMRS